MSIFIYMWYYFSAIENLRCFCMAVRFRMFGVWLSWLPPSYSVPCNNPPRGSDVSSCYRRPPARAVVSVIAARWLSRRAGPRHSNVLGFFHQGCAFWLDSAVKRASCKCTFSRGISAALLAPRQVPLVEPPAEHVPSHNLMDWVGTQGWKICLSADGLRQKFLLFDGFEVIGLSFPNLEHAMS